MLSLVIRFYSREKWTIFSRESKCDRVRCWCVRWIVKRTHACEKKYCYKIKFIHADDEIRKWRGTSLTRRDEGSNLRVCGPRRKQRAVDRGAPISNRSAWMCTVHVRDITFLFSGIARNRPLNSRGVGMNDTQNDSISAFGFRRVTACDIDTPVRSLLFQFRALTKVPWRAMVVYCYSNDEELRSK